ncbi:MAG TPA: nuclear transport factor 2 family protein [Polyangium sp.]|nr:nuclear transport factor 2 family protein [Polyangium sp.]
MTNSFAGSFGRRVRLALLAAAGLTAAALLSANFVDASPPGGSVATEAQIAKLTSCYAHGTDAIGRGDLQLGKDIYEPCFTADAELEVYFPGTPLNGPPSFETVGTESWANFVASVFSANGYSATQHMMGTVDVNLTDGAHATMTSYLHATHVLSDGTIDVANGAYEDEVVRQNGTWKIKRRTLKLITFLNLGTPIP